MRTGDDSQDLLLQGRGIAEFLQHLAVLGETLFGDEGEVPCGLMSQRGNRKSTVASSSPTAEILNEGQSRVGEGPALEASASGEVVVVEDASSDARWARYFGLSDALGFASVLAAPLRLGTEGIGVLTFYARPRSFFTRERQRVVGVFVEQASRALEMAMRVARHQDTSEDLLQAMESRTSIDIAIGIIIAQNRCTQEEAFALLKSASNSRNTKLREVAESLIVQATGKASSTHFTN
ncbi:GAF and ANTAR domain-containing protein [Arthrobacter sp. B0490]|uniref:GAF and ANTAR domain-containing protein n=1 Tax=Arthrobacter sp. B0490 TaxID=2058891 RepID=UPI0015E3034D|nr:GAF and ANTAR domain-containing protein [Arthrobacter sp. B0490]